MGHMWTTAIIIGIIKFALASGKGAVAPCKNLDILPNRQALHPTKQLQSAPKLSFYATLFNAVLGRPLYITACKIIVRLLQVLRSPVRSSDMDKFWHCTWAVWWCSLAVLCSQSYPVCWLW